MNKNIASGKENLEMKKNLRGELMLLATALIWGTAFVAQKSGVDVMGPIAFNSIRLLIGGVSLLPVIYVMDKLKGRQSSSDEIEASAGGSASSSAMTKADKRAEWKKAFKGGVLCGLALLGAASFQQIGICYTTAGKSGFITALYVVIVPILSVFFLHKKVRPVIWLCVIASAVGLYLLCMPAGGGFSELNKGDMIIPFAALMFAVHIIIIDIYTPDVDGVRMSCIQFFTAGVLTLFFIWIDPLLGFSLPTLGSMVSNWLPLLYTGILSAGVAYTFQILGQADTDPTIASMILCLESVFAVLSGILLLGESLSMRELIGCIIMFAAIIVAQLPDKRPAAAPAGESVTGTGPAAAQIESAGSEPDAKDSSK